MTQSVLLYVLAAILIAVGLAGSILPILPGVPLVFLGMLLAAWVDHFEHIGAVTLTVLGILTVIAIAIDFVASALGAKRVGASGWAVFGAAVGTIVGVFLGIFGIVFGPFVGALIGELVAGGTLRRATGVGVATWIGFLFGTLLKIALCFTMLGVFALGWLLN